MANIIDVEIKMKIITKMQKHRANYKTENVENMKLINFSEFQYLFNIHTIPLLIILFLNYS